MMKFNKKGVLKILALIIGPIIPMMIAAYFLFPYLNTTKYQKVVRQFKKEHRAKGMGIDTSDVYMMGDDSDTLNERDTERDTERVFQKSIDKLRTKIDSFKAENDSLNALLVVKDKQIKMLKAQQKAGSNSASTTTQNKKVSDKQFTENMKSLLSLDTELLTPIIKEMSDNDVIRLYEKASSLQKRKLLQSLKASRAAKLMEKVL